MKKVEPVYTGAAVRLCDFCKHDYRDGTGRCAAYPEGEGIPLEIIYMNVDHRTPYLDDHGILFELREDMSEWEYRHLFLDSFCVFRGQHYRAEYEAQIDRILAARK